MNSHDSSVQQLTGALFAFCLGALVFILVDYAGALTDAELAELTVKREQDRADELHQLQMDIQMLQAAPLLLKCE